MTWRTRIASVAESEDPGGGDVGFLALDEHERAGQPGDLGPLRDRDDEGDHRDGRPEQGDHEQQHHQQRQRQLGLEEAGDDGVDPAAEVARERAEDDADEPGDEDGEQADGQGHLAAVQDPREQVAASWSVPNRWPSVSGGSRRCARSVGVRVGQRQHPREGDGQDDQRARRSRRARS